MYVLCTAREISGVNHGDAILSETPDGLVLHCRDCREDIPLEHVSIVHLIDDMEWNQTVDDIDTWISEPNPSVPLSTYRKVMSCMQRYPRARVTMGMLEPVARPIGRRQAGRRRL